MRAFVTRVNRVTNLIVRLERRSLLFVWAFTFKEGSSFVRGEHFVANPRESQNKHRQMLLALGLLVLDMLVLAGALALVHRAPVPASALAARRKLWF